MRPAETAPAPRRAAGAIAGDMELPDRMTQIFTEAQGIKTDPADYEAALRDWCKDEREFVRRAGFAMIAWRAVHLKKEPDTTFLGYFPLIRAGAIDTRTSSGKPSTGRCGK